MSLLKMFLACAAENPRGQAFIDERGEWNFLQLKMTTQALTGLVLKSTQRQMVGIMMPTCKEHAAMFYAIQWAGKVPVPLNFLLAPEQLGYVVKHAEMDTIFTVSYFEEAARKLCPNVIVLDKLPPPQGLPPAIPVPDLKMDDVAALIYTSGTEANPKGALLTHGNLCSQVESLMQLYSLDPATDKLLAILPYFHVYALTTTLACPTTRGIPVYTLPQFDPLRVFRVIGEQKITRMVIIASFFRILIRAYKAKGPFDLSSVITWISGGEAVPEELVGQFRQITGGVLSEGYGQTEGTTVTSVNTPTDYKAGTAGKPIPGVEVKIIDHDGRTLPVGQEGEIMQRGPNVMKGYYKDPQKTAETIEKDGWQHTGDLGRLDADGYLKITGRIKETIVVSGENCSPTEIEDVISKHPAVFEIGVVPMRDEVRGEVPKAYVALQPGATATEEELKEFARKTLPPYKVPKAIEFLAELPHGPTGKILRRKLKEMSMKK
ncbi:MAG TPA: AMP-binding protein [Candidatus Brocadiia bacterium]|nr:AMP-binding protein [Candidatus Brocadiia bacterium]